VSGIEWKVGSGPRHTRSNWFEPHAALCTPPTTSYLLKTSSIQEFSKTSSSVVLTQHSRDRHLTRQVARRWRGWAVGKRLSEQGGMALASQFAIYIKFLVQIIRLLQGYSIIYKKKYVSIYKILYNANLRGSLFYDSTSLEALQTTVLRLRRLQGIPGRLLGWCFFEL